MSDSAGGLHPRQALEQFLKELGRLRNQTGPTIAFKKWRQGVLAAITALWPDDRSKLSRFMRVPFLPPSAKADRTEVRRVYDRGCGEAVAYLKALIAEHDKEVQAGKRASAEGGAMPAGDVLPDLSWLEQDAGAGADAELPAADLDDLRSVTEEFLSSSPVFAVRGSSNAPRADAPKQELSPTALAIMAMAVEIESLGVPSGDRPRVREALLDLARSLDSPNFSWSQLRLAVEVVMEFPAIGRRVLPMIVPFLDRAA